jgi:hypothetical protein
MKLVISLSPMLISSISTQSGYSSGQFDQSVVNDAYSFFATYFQQEAELIVTGQNLMQTKLLIEQAKSFADPLKVLRKFKKALELLSNDAAHSLKVAMQSDVGQDLFRSYRTVIAYILSEVETYTQKEGTVDRVKIEQLRREIDRIAKALYWELERVVNHRSSELRFVVVLDDEQQIPIIYDADSAEGKTLQRIHDVEDESNWVTYVERGEPIDLDDLDARLKSGGYLE